MFKLRKMILCFLLSSTLCLDAVPFSTPQADLINAFAKGMSLSTSKTILTSLLAFISGMYISNYHFRREEYNEMVEYAKQNDVTVSDLEPVESIWIPVTVGAATTGLIALVSLVDETSSIDTQDYIKQTAAIPLAIGSITAITIGVCLGWDAMAKLCATIKQKFYAEEPQAA